MNQIIMLINLFVALWIRQVFISREYEKVIFKYYNKYGFLRNDTGVFKVLDNLEEREQRKKIIIFKLKKIKSLFRK